MSYVYDWSRCPRFEILFWKAEEMEVESGFLLDKSKVCHQNLTFDISNNRIQAHVARLLRQQGTATWNKSTLPLRVGEL